MSKPTTPTAADILHSDAYELAVWHAMLGGLAAAIAHLRESPGHGFTAFDVHLIGANAICTTPGRDHRPPLVPMPDDARQRQIAALAAEYQEAHRRMTACLPRREDTAA